MEDEEEKEELPCLQSFVFFFFFLAKVCRERDGGMVKERGNIPLSRQTVSLAGRECSNPSGLLTPPC